MLLRMHVHKVGDHVMQLRNNYNKNKFNGDIGIIEQIKTEEKTLVITFNNALMVYAHNKLDEINIRDFHI